MPTPKIKKQSDTNDHHIVCTTLNQINLYFGVDYIKYKTIK